MQKRLGGDFKAYKKYSKDMAIVNLPPPSTGPGVRTIEGRDSKLFKLIGS